MEYKVCTKCGKNLPITDFYWRDKKLNKRRSECKYCHNAYVKEKYAKRHSQVEEIKGTLCCAKCGESREYVLDFHHINPAEKDAGISRLLRCNAPWDRIAKEMEKCVVLCANCHREFHFLEKTQKIDIQQYLAG